MGVGIRYVEIDLILILSIEWIAVAYGLNLVGLFVTSSSNVGRLDFFESEKGDVIAMRTCFRR